MQELQVPVLSRTIQALPWPLQRRIMVPYEEHAYYASCPAGASQG